MCELSFSWVSRFEAAYQPTLSRSIDLPRRRQHLNEAFYSLQGQRQQLRQSSGINCYLAMLSWTFQQKNTLLFDRLQPDTQTLWSIARRQCEIIYGELQLTALRATAVQPQLARRFHRADWSIASVSLLHGWYDA